MEGQIIRVGVTKGPKYLRSMTEGELNDRNDIFLPMYYALFFLGTSNMSYWHINRQKIELENILNE